MTDPIQVRLGKLFRGIGVRQVRLACGVVLFAYLVSHFLNHALGNISMDALATGVRYHTAFWQFPPVAFLFYGSTLIHAGLGIWALYQRRQFRWRAIEPLQLVLGLSIPTLVISHVVGVRLGQVMFGHEKFYPQELYGFLVVWPYKIWLMTAVLLIAWIHGSIGLYFWLRMKAFYRRAAPFLLAAAVLVPTLALLGFYQAGRSVVADSNNPEWRTSKLGERQVGTPAQQQTLDDIADDLLAGYLGLIALVLLAKGARALYERRGGMITLSYGNGRTIRVP
ncbi:MAG TPA: adenylate/guanylate cyclase domain-containing protein, partial [Bradyrhizobium sp.]|nr:adenylate/guanylate cyclase domain-containing protein [Bradyrhizobium sp.]